MTKRLEDTFGSHHDHSVYVHAVGDVHDVYGDPGDDIGVGCGDM